MPAFICETMLHACCAEFQRSGCDFCPEVLWLWYENVSWSHVWQ